MACQDYRERQSCAGVTDRQKTVTASVPKGSVLGHALLPKAAPPLWVKSTGREPVHRALGADLTVLRLLCPVRRHVPLTPAPESLSLTHRSDVPGPGHHLPCLGTTGLAPLLPNLHFATNLPLNSCFNPPTVDPQGPWSKGQILR